ncbi:unnamed protein product [Owenia fusiformis]|uniref:Uncharacterized protein n=1 Tax=Owenia fusiformis TaxID=6347 RepID=A0A8J1T5T2_OWEFU|nr:unnamed protein product [Owenia fusiformis]
MWRHLWAACIIVTSYTTIVLSEASMKKRMCQSYKDCAVGEYCHESRVNLAVRGGGKQKHIKAGVCTAGKLREERCDPTILCHCGLGFDCRVPPSRTNKLLFHQYTCQLSDFARDKEKFPKRYLMLLKCEIRTKEGDNIEAPIFDR